MGTNEKGTSRLLETSACGFPRLGVLLCGDPETVRTVASCVCSMSHMQQSKNISMLVACTSQVDKRRAPKNKAKEESVAMASGFGFGFVAAKAVPLPISRPAKWP